MGIIRGRFGFSWSNESASREPFLSWGVVHHREPWDIAYPHGFPFDMVCLHYALCVGRYISRNLSPSRSNSCGKAYALPLLPGVSGRFEEGECVS